MDKLISLNEFAKEIENLENVKDRFIETFDKIAALMKRYELDTENIEKTFDEKIIKYIEGLNKEHSK